MKKAVTLFAALALASQLGAAGGIEQQTPVKDFRLPFFNPDGSRSAFLRGDEARYIDTTKFKITQLNFALFAHNGGTTPETVLIAPEALVSIHGKQPIIEGDQAVRLIRDDLEASGEAWTYDHAERHLTLSRNVHVTFAAEFKNLLK